MTNGQDNRRIEESRISFVWAETVLGPLAGDDSIASTPRPFAIYDTEYAEYFDARTGDLTPPWPAYGVQGFWHEYMELRQLGDVSGKIAYKQLVPLRVGNAVRAAPAFEGATFLSEGFVYPWGSALVLTLRDRRDRTGLRDPIADLLRLRHDPWLRTGTESDEVLRLDELARRGLEALRESTFGDAEARPVASEPFSIHTVVRASGDRAEFSPEVETVQRYLHVATGFRKSWETDTLTPLGDATVLGRKNAPADHLVYGRRRGRAVWGPDNFLMAGGQSHALGCQHRNLVFASTQVESIGAFAAATVARMQGTGGQLEPLHRALAKRAAILLPSAYHGTSTFRSGSLKRHIEENGWLPAIDTLRDRLGLPAIGPKPATD
jgi:hypothetical protein